jgi:hypothetical protein
MTNLCECDLCRLINISNQYSIQRQDATYCQPANEGRLRYKGNTLERYGFKIEEHDDHGCTCIYQWHEWGSVHEIMMYYQQGFCCILKELRPAMCFELQPISSNL